MPGGVPPSPAHRSGRESWGRTTCKAHHCKSVHARVGLLPASSARGSPPTSEEGGLQGGPGGRSVPSLRRPGPLPLCSSSPALLVREEPCAGPLALGPPPGPPTTPSFTPAPAPDISEMAALIPTVIWRPGLILVPPPTFWKPPTLLGGDQEAYGSRPGRGSRDPLGTIHQGVRGWPPLIALQRTPPEPATSCWRGQSQALGDSPSPLRPYLPELCSWALWTRSAKPVCSVQSPTRTSGLQMRPPGPYRLRVEGPAGHGVGSLLVEALTQDHHHGKGLRHWAPAQGGHEPSSGGQTGGADATSWGVSRAMTSAEAAPHRGGAPPGNSGVTSALWKDKRKAEGLRTAEGGRPEKHSPSSPGGDPAGEWNCLTTELRCFLGGWRDTKARITFLGVPMLALERP